MKDKSRHPLFARFYAVISPAMDRNRVIEHRRRLLAGLTGEVVEIEAGNGLNFPHYSGSLWVPKSVIDGGDLLHR